MNPGSVSEATVAGWVREGVIEWWGERDDMPAVLAKAHVVVLPALSREGMPTILAEAAACGRAVVTTPLPGCRDVVVDDVTGVLVAVGDVDGLAAAVAALLADPDRRARYGAAARLRVASLFSREHVARQTLNGYADAMAGLAGR